MKFELRNTSQLDYSLMLQNLVGLRLKVRINNNRSTMLHVRWHEDDTNILVPTQVSLHRMFMEAPIKVQNAVVRYIKREDDVLDKSAKDFIQKNVSSLDHSHLTKPEEMSTKGSTYNLQKLYTKINKRYFEGKLDLIITWFGDPSARFSTKCTLGLYYDVVKLVKIHRLLDNPAIPEYVIEYVIYHEMVHAVCPAYVNSNGRNCIHTKEFKELESVFVHFDAARDWLTNHHKNFFVSQRMNSNGRTQQMGKHKAPKKQSRCSKGQDIYTYL